MDNSGLSDIKDIQQTNVFINELTGSAYFSSEIFRKIVVRSSLMAGVFDVALGLILLYLNHSQALDTLVILNGLLSIHALLALTFAYQAHASQQINPKILLLLDVSTILSISYSAFAYSVPGFYLLIVAILVFNIIHEAKRAFTFSILSISSYYALLFIGSPSLSPLNMSLAFITAGITLIVVGYLRKNLDHVIRSAKNITERLEQISSDLSDLLNKEKYARIQAEELDQQSELYNARAFQKALEKEFFLKRLKKDQLAKESLININVTSIELNSKTLSLASEAALYLEIGTRLKNIFNHDWLIGRISKDEFVIYDKTGQYCDAILNFASNAQSSLRAPIFIDTKSIYLEIKCGVANEVVSNTNDLLRHAQIASFYAIERNIDTPILFDIAFEISVAKNESILRQIRASIDQSSFSLFLQPIVHLASKKLLKAEALIRMQDASGNYIPPDSFISLAERHGLINDITRWVVKNSCEQLQLLRKNYHPDFEISVNISPSDLNHPTNFLQLIRDAVTQYDLPFNAITIEITEGVFLEANQTTMGIFNTLKELGVKISLDDFGTGYSSLSYLDNLGVDYLKIDRSFIKDILKNPNRFAICDGLIQISRQLGIDVVAEGIETEEQMELLKKIHCNYGQGYLFCKPLAANEFLTFVHEFR